MALGVLRIVPPAVALNAGETQAFEAIGDDGKPAASVKWTIATDGVGTIGPDTGTYSAPARVYRSRRLAIVARQHDSQGVETARGSAIVDIDPSGSWVPVLGVSWIALFLLMLITLLGYWQELCPQCTPPGLFISPPVVTLTEGQAQQFVTDSSVTWANTVNLAGLYIAPTSIDAEQLVSVTATSRSDPQQAAAAVVRLSPSAGFTVLPSRMTLHPGTKVRLTTVLTGNATSPSWLPPAAGTISPDGIYTAPAGREPQAVIVLAQAQVPASSEAPASTVLAGALVTIVPSPPGPCDVPGSDIWRLILLVAWVGALGGLTHAMGSFGTYVGNRELKASWLWWYGLKPALSAAVAVLVFLVFRAGLAPDLGLVAGDCLKVAGFAGLVGLFAEPATVKLKDIFDAFFTPRRDPREDKAGQTAPTLPEIHGVTPAVVKAADTTTLRITGRHFADWCAVQIGTQSFQPGRVSAALLEVRLAPGTLPIGSHKVVVFNKPPAGEASAEKTLTVEP